MRRAPGKPQLLAAIVFFTFGAAALADPPRYSLTNLYDPLGSGLVWYPLKINNSGEIMDSWYFWKPGEPAVRLDFVGTDFNDHGVVVGSTNWCCDPSAKAVRWSPVLGLQEVGDGIALGINNTGEIVGSSFGTTGAWKWTAEGGTQHLLAAGRPASGVNDINESGEIVGSDGNVWRWRPNEVVGEPVTDVSSNSARINNHGQITGQLAYEPYSAFLYTPGEGVRDLGRFPVPESEYGITPIPHGINDMGYIVGAATNDIDDDLGTAWLWTPQDGMLNLNDLVDAPGWKLRDAADINESGQIVGWGELKGLVGESGNTLIVPFLLTPIPEPGMAGLLVLLGLMARRRR